MGRCKVTARKAGKTHKCDRPRGHAGNHSQREGEFGRVYWPAPEPEEMRP